MNLIDFFKGKIKCLNTRKTLVLIFSVSIVLFAILFFSVRFYFKRKYASIFVDSALKNELGVTLDQKLTLTQDELKKYIDQKFQGIDKKIDKINESQDSHKNHVDSRIKKEVKKQMSGLKEDRLKKLMEIKEREERKAVLKKMVEEQDY